MSGRVLAYPVVVDPVREAALAWYEADCAWRVHLGERHAALMLGGPVPGGQRDLETAVILAREALRAACAGSGDERRDPRVSGGGADALRSRSASA